MRNKRHMLAIIKAQVYRGYVLVGILGWLFLIVDALAERLNWALIDTAIVFIPTALIGLWLAGIIDDKLGLTSGEQKYYATRNPVMRDILKKLDEMDNKLKQLKRKQVK